MPFQATGYVPQYGDRIAELMMRQGEIAARRAERSGMIWGRAIENIGQIAGNAVENYQQDKILKKKDEGIYSVMQSWDGQDPTVLVKGLATYIGPVEAVKVAGGLQKLMEAKQVPQLDASHIAGPVGALAALERSSPGHLQRNWGMIFPQIEDLAKQAGLPVSPEWSEDMTKGVITLDQQFNPPKPGGELVETVDAQGNPVKRRATEAELSSPGGVPVWKKPDETSYQSKDVLLDGQRAVVGFNPKTMQYFRPGANGTLEDVSTRVQPIPPASAGDRTVGRDEYSPEDLELFPQTWLDVHEGTKTKEDYTIRQSKSSPRGARVDAMDAATRAGRVLIDGKEKKEVLAGQKAVAQARRIAAMLDAPVDPAKPNGPKVSSFFGPMGPSYMAEWRAAGYGKKLPESVLTARAAIGKFAAKDRHELFGAALTELESRFAVSFEPDLSSPADTIKAQLSAYATGIAKGFESTWGPGRLKSGAGNAPPRPANVDANYNWDEALQAWRAP